MKTRLGWRHLTSESMQEMQFDRATTRIETPPWRKSPFEFDAVNLVMRKEKYSQPELKRKSMEKIVNLDSEIIVYSDGSTNGKQEKGGAGVYIEDTRTGEKHEFSYPAGKLCSSYSSECLGLLKALEWIQCNPGSSTICTDSLSLQQALQNNKWKDSNHLVMKFKDIARSINHGGTRSPCYGSRPIATWTETREAMPGRNSRLTRNRQGENKEEEVVHHTRSREADVR